MGTLVNIRKRRFSRPAELALSAAKGRAAAQPLHRPDIGGIDVAQSTFAEA
jgi:hypothetical protein